nr:hypothetical protein [Tanacetum cinerariifolium]
MLAFFCNTRTARLATQAFHTHLWRCRQLSTASQISKHTTAPAKEAVRGLLKNGTIPQLAQRGQRAEQALGVPGARLLPEAVDGGEEIRISRAEARRSIGKGGGLAQASRPHHSQNVARVGGRHHLAALEAVEH